MNNQYIWALPNFIVVVFLVNNIIIWLNYRDLWWPWAWLPIDIYKNITRLSLAREVGNLFLGTDCLTLARQLHYEVPFF